MCYFGLSGILEEVYIIISIPLLVKWKNKSVMEDFLIQSKCGRKFLG